MQQPAATPTSIHSDAPDLRAAVMASRVDRPPVVQALVALIESQGWQQAFEDAMQRVRAHAVPSLRGIDTLAGYLDFLDALVHWAPREQGDSQQVHDKLVEFHFVLDQPPLRALQQPGSVLSAWITDFANAWGSYLDTTASAAHVETFRGNPGFHWDDYMAPPSGYLTFNQFFARHVKPGRRPVDAPGDDNVVVSPADASFIGTWPVDADVDITVKRMRWSLRQLLADSPHADRFAGGMFTHSALRTFDYHRFHAPMAGRVVEARVIQGRAWLDVSVKETLVDGQSCRVLHAEEGTGYQFTQTRGLLVLQTPRGLVACLAVGMAQVSSVVFTAEVGVDLRKGEEMGYFQFGGSDFVMVFARGMQAEMQCAPQQHVEQGRAVGRSRAG